MNTLINVIITIGIKNRKNIYCDNSEENLRKLRPGLKERYVDNK